MCTGVNWLCLTDTGMSEVKRLSLSLHLILLTLHFCSFVRWVITGHLLTWFWLFPPFIEEKANQKKKVSFYDDITTLCPVSWCRSPLESHRWLPSQVDLGVMPGRGSFALTEQNELDSGLKCTQIQGWALRVKAPLIIVEWFQWGQLLLIKCVTFSPVHVPFEHTASPLLVFLPRAAICRTLLIQTCSSWFSI